MDKMKTYEFYKPYGVLRVEPAKASCERYDTDSKSWVMAYSEFQMIFDPDPGESASPISQEQCQALIDSGTLR